MKKELLEIAQLLLTIEEKGIASVSHDYTGHIPYLGIRIYKDQAFAFPVYSVSIANHDNLRYTACIEVLRSISENGLSGIPGYENRLTEIRKQKEEQLKKLQAELA